MTRADTGHSTRHLTCLALVVSVEVSTPAQTPASATSDEPRFRYAVIDNGDFAEAGVGQGDTRIPWWRSSGVVARVATDGSASEIVVGRGAWLEQPIPVFSPLVSSLRLRGKSASEMRWTLSRNGGEVVLDGRSSRRDAPVGPIEFDPLPGSDRELGPSAVPRFSLRLDGTDPPSSWRAVEVTADLPCPNEAALRAEIVELVQWIFATWFDLGIDDVGPKMTSFLARDFDAVTGERFPVARTTGFSSVYQALFDALEVEELPAWRRRFDLFMEDYLALQIAPETGLPRNWDPTADVPDERTPIEIALPLGFLIDVAERGSERFRERAKSAAKKIGATVLARGLMPDGTCAASYAPKDGAPNLNVSHLRRLDVPLQLVRLSKLTRDPRYAQSTRDPLAALDFTNLWAGTWDAIDPGFDDNFGHFGARATRIALEDPSQALYRRFALEGWRHYAPIWRDALRFGGNIAADQTRCWKIGVDLARIEPTLRAEMGPLLRAAARSHFKGEQYGNGAWGDVTIFDFGPRSTLQVGDLPGVPQNLLHGLASIYVDDLGLRTPEIRAMYTAVLRSSVTHYKRRYGFLIDREERKGPNSSYGSVRILTGLVEMLRALSKSK